MSDVVRLISGGAGLVLDTCDGKRTIAEAENLFSHIDPDFKNRGTNVAGRATPETLVTVHEIVENVNFTKMFGALADDPSRLVLTQDQIIQFVERHRSWLRQDGWATFFLFQSGSKFFVALVNCYSDGYLRVSVDRLEYFLVWLAVLRYRLVVPQL